jgi:hypothetical protein
MGFLETTSWLIERLCHKFGSDVEVTPWPHATEQRLLKDAKVEAARETAPRAATVVARVGAGEAAEPLLDNAA